MKYLLDSNTFIEAKNKYYGMDICPGYWNWIDKKFNAGEVASIESVGKELINGNDELKLWVIDNPNIFLDVSDVGTQTAYATVAAHVMALPGMKIGSKEEFLSGADPWLIAKAMTLNSTVVTHEHMDVACKRKVLIPNICKDFNVNVMNTFVLLKTLSAQFHLR